MRYGSCNLVDRRATAIIDMKLESRFEWNRRTYVMGILNTTPDSFSGDGTLSTGDTIERAVNLARSHIECGADILDIGGESTRPGSEPVTAEIERSRVLPVITEIKSLFPECIISVDTYRAEVAADALDCGAEIVNDVWALRADPEMAPMLAARDAPVILMHNRSRPNDVLSDVQIGSEYAGAAYEHVVDDVARELVAAVGTAVEAGIRREQIIVDPGIGFGKTVTENLALLNHLQRLKVRVDQPVLIGPSRKSFIGRVLDVAVEDRLEGTAAAVTAGIFQGADIVRVHDVQAMVRVARMSDGIKSAPADGKVDS